MRDQTRNIETFKVGATRVNQFDFHKHQGEMHEHHEPARKHDGRASLRAQQVAEVTKQAHEKVARRKKRR